MPTSEDERRGVGDPPFVGLGAAVDMKSSSMMVFS